METKPEEKSTNPKDAIGLTKPPLSLVPSAGTISEAIAFWDGADKYGPYNWRKNKVSLRVYLDAALRHILRELDGQTLDPDSKHGATNLGCARACLGIIEDARATGNLVDDRPLPGAAPELITKYTEKKP